MRVLDMLLGGGIGLAVALAIRSAEGRYWRNAGKRSHKRSEKLLEKEEKRRRSLGYS